MIELTRTTDPYGSAVEPERVVEKPPATGWYLVTEAGSAGSPLDNWTGPFGSKPYAQEFRESLGITDVRFVKALATEVTADELADVGSIVVYEDMANPAREYVVVKKTTDPWSPFTLCATDTLGLTQASLKGHWKVKAS